VDVKRCPYTPIVTLERRSVPPFELGRYTVPLSGQMNADVIRTTTFILRAQNRDLAKATVTVNSALERDDEVICSAMEWIELGNMHSGRVVLVGVAAHASSPMMGQGGCMAMEDACVLADELRAAATVENALASYARRRKPRVDWVQHQSMGLVNILTASSAARNCTLRERGAQLMRDRFGPLVPSP